MRRALLVFAREPNVATAKTRLASLFNEAERLAFAEAMLRDIAEIVRSVKCEQRVVCWAPEAEPVLLRLIFGDAEFVSQEGDDLGERMLRALRSVLSDGRDYTSAVLIGSDTPMLGTDSIESAFELLERRSLVLAPSFDGGYGLVGARSGIASRLPYVFQGMRWSRPDVLAETVERLVQIHYLHPEVSLGLLPMCYDVDTPADVERLRAHIRALRFAHQPVPRHTAEYLDRYRAATDRAPESP